MVQDKNYRTNRRKYTDYLKANGITFSVTFTNRTFVVESKFGKRIFMGGDITKRGLGFMKKVQKDILENLQYLKHLNKDYDKLGLTRMSFNKSVKSGTHSSIIELDIDAAYWSAAYKLGVISDSIYQEGLHKGYKKVELLACLGSLAKKKRKREWNGKKYSKSVIINDNSNTSFLWDAISFEIDKLMKMFEKNLGNDFFFYWTDAVFISNNTKTLQAAKNIFDKYGFGYKFIPVEYGVFNYDIQKVFVFTKENKSHAKKPLRDAKGNYGRVFTMVSGQNIKNLVLRISEFYKRKR